MRLFLSLFLCQPYSVFSRCPRSSRRPFGLGKGGPGASFLLIFSNVGPLGHRLLDPFTNSFFPFSGSFLPVAAQLFPPSPFFFSLCPIFFCFSKGQQIPCAKKEVNSADGCSVGCGSSPSFWLHLILFFLFYPKPFSFPLPLRLKYSCHPHERFELASPLLAN